jgi:Leucine-rich repeat (LRR) protein
VSELKRAIGRLRELAYFVIELFIKDVEDALADERPLSSVGRVPLFLLMRAATDRLALEALFKNTNGPDWTEKDGWCTDAALGDWNKVDVDAEGRVVKLKLKENGLAGSISSELQQLSCLQRLVRHKNQLMGCIPAELGQLGSLVKLTLNGNQLSGSIPTELGQLGALSLLRLNGNQLSGCIPAELGQLGALTHLVLYNNQLSGCIPMELGQPGGLVHLRLDGNQLTGMQPFRSYMQEHRAGCNLRL